MANYVAGTIMNTNERKMRRKINGNSIVMKSLYAKSSVMAPLVKFAKGS